MFRTNFNKLREARTKEQNRHRLIPISEIADRTGLTHLTLTKWARGKPMTRVSADAVQALADYFGVSIEQLIYIDSGESKTRTGR